MKKIIYAIAILLALSACSATGKSNDNDNYIKIPLKELTKLQKMDEAEFNTEVLKLGFDVSQKDVRGEEGNNIAYYFKKGYNPSIGYNFFVGMAVLDQMPLISKSNNALRYTFPISEFSHYTTALSRDFEKLETKKYDMPDGNGKYVEVEEVSYKDKANNIWYTFACTDAYCMLVID